MRTIKDSFTLSDSSPILQKYGSREGLAYLVFDLGMVDMSIPERHIADRARGKTVFPALDNIDNSSQVCLTISMQQGQDSICRFLHFCEIIVSSLWVM